MHVHLYINPSRIRVCTYGGSGAEIWVVACRANQDPRASLRKRPPTSRSDFMNIAAPASEGGENLRAELESGLIEKRASAEPNPNKAYEYTGRGSGEGTA
jgi:hypothetical protein